MMNSQWHPTARLDNLVLRAQILNSIRQFFRDRNVLEVETPLLCHTTATDPHLSSFETYLFSERQQSREKLYLQTSPEFPMKRMLAAGYGSIFQICKAFRNAEIGKRHNPEFTLLEWYRVNMNHFQLMEEIDSLLQVILHTQPAEYISYHQLFNNFLGINPHTCSIEALQEIAYKNNINFICEGTNKDTWLDLVLTHFIEPHLGRHCPLFVYDYPQSQAALAKIRQEGSYAVGERFELYYKGLELANGYHELGDSQEQGRRFLDDNLKRTDMGLPTIPLDHKLLAALPNLPMCAGVALGIDRLLLIATNENDIKEVISFPITQV